MISNLHMIVAYDRNRTIGFVEDMPWKRDLPADLQNFKRLTTGNTIIMGRVTYESIGKALPNRKTIVITRNRNWNVEDAQIVHSLGEISENDIEGKAYIVGGAQIYELALPLVQKVIATEVDAEFDADTYLEALGEDFAESSREHHEADDKNKYNFDIVEYTRSGN